MKKITFDTKKSTETVKDILNKATDASKKAVEDVQKATLQWKINQ